MLTYEEFKKTALFGPSKEEKERAAGAADLMLSDRRLRFGQSILDSTKETYGAEASVKAWLREAADDPEELMRRIEHFKQLDDKYGKDAPADIQKLEEDAKKSGDPALQIIANVWSKRKQAEDAEQEEERKARQETEARESKAKAQREAKAKAKAEAKAKAKEAERAEKEKAKAEAAKKRKEERAAIREDSDVLSAEQRKKLREEAVANRNKSVGSGLDWDAFVAKHDKTKGVKSETKPDAWEQFKQEHGDITPGKSIAKNPDFDKAFKSSDKPADKATTSKNDALYAALDAAVGSKKSDKPDDFDARFKQIEQKASSPKDKKPSKTDDKSWEAFKRKYDTGSTSTASGPRALTVAEQEGQQWQDRLEVESSKQRKQKTTPDAFAAFNAKWNELTAKHDKPSTAGDQRFAQQNAELDKVKADALAKRNVSMPNHIDAAFAGAEAAVDARAKAKADARASAAAATTAAPQNPTYEESGSHVSETKPQDTKTTPANITNPPKSKKPGVQPLDVLVASGVGGVAGLAAYGLAGAVPQIHKRKILRALIGLTAGAGAGLGSYYAITKT